MNGDYPRFDAADDYRPATSAGSARRRALAIKWAIGLAGAAVVAVFFNPFYGFESKRISSKDGINRSGITLSLGSKRIFARAGQKIHLQCDAKVDAGRIALRIFEGGLQSPINAPLLESTSVTKSGKVELVANVRNTGLHRISIESYRDGGRLEVDYTASWRAR